MKIAIPGLLILIGLVGLVTMGILQGAIPEVGVQSLRMGDYEGKIVRLQGVIHAIDSDVRPMRFTIRDIEDPSVRIIASVDDHRPDIFKVDTDVAVIGVFVGKTELFEGTKIFTKCPSKYEESGVMGSADVYGSAPESAAPPPTVSPPDPE